MILPSQGDQRMNTSRLILATAVLVLAGAAAHSAGKPSKRVVKNEATLAKMLEGRTAGEPVSCIPLYQTNRLEVLDGVALVYNFGDIIYVGRPTDPETLRRDDILVIERFGSQLCDTDVVRTVDRDGGFMTGVVFLKKFVPYKKQD
jgi:hypothetical protein